MTNLLAISYLLLTLTNFVETIEPTEDNPAYYTNYAGTNLEVSGVAELTALIGPAVLLAWPAVSGVVYVQWSEDLEMWWDVRVAQVGAIQWWSYPASETRFYRLRR